MRRRRIRPNAQRLVIIENVPVDDQFSSPKQCNYSAALGKVLIAGANANVHLYVRNPDQSFYSKYYKSGYSQGFADADSMYLYHGGSVAVVKFGINDLLGTNAGSCIISSIRMIDFQSDPTYGYVSSNNATDGHGVRMIRKSDMTVVASLLATGSSDGQFSNPLGVKYYDGHLYVCDTSNNRIVKLNVVRTAGSESITFDSNISTAFTNSICDLATDGINWFIVRSNYISKTTMDFADSGVSSVNIAGMYSICIIPDQSDGNGSTVCAVNNTSAVLYRRKCIDLSAVSNIGSSGDGSSSLFDPTFTTLVSTTITYQSDDGITYTTPAGTSHALSMNGFAAAFHRTAGPHRWVVRCAAGLGAITGINANSDAINSIKNVIKLNKVTSFAATGNTAYVLSLSELPKSIISLYLSDCYSSVSGNLSDLWSGLLNVEMKYCTNIVGTLLSAPSTLQSLYLYGDTLIAPASIAHLTAIHDLRIYSMGWNQTGVNLVISSAWGARASYTYATPSMQIGGTNAAPSGTYAAPSEGTDWHEDSPGHWVPLTGKAMIYDLMNDVNGEGFNVWTITYTA